MFVRSSGTKGSPSGDSPHALYCLKRADVHKDLAAFRRIAEDIAELGKVGVHGRAARRRARTVLEMFGGSGWHSAVIADVVKPKKHRILENSLECLDSLRRSLPEADIVHADSFEAARGRFGKSSYDWIHADFNQFTLKRALDDPAYKGVLSGIFTQAELYVTITDSAVFGVKRFAGNREAYAKLLRVDIKDELDYFKAAAAYYSKLYDFGMQRVITWDGMASMYLLRRGYNPSSALVVERQKKAADVRIIGNET